MINNTIHKDTIHKDTINKDTIHKDTIHKDTIHKDTIHKDTIHIMLLKSPSDNIGHEGVFNPDGVGLNE